MQLGIGQCQRVHFLQPWEFLLVFCRCDPEALSCFLIVLLLFGKHPIIDKTYTAKASGKILFLFFIRVKPVLSYDIFPNGSLFFCHLLPPASQCTFLSLSSIEQVFFFVFRNSSPTYSFTFIQCLYLLYFVHSLKLGEFLHV